ncbi:MAG: hypothetical protein K2Q18_10100 [Bdellovibrionales bacterium]|nr:hypothetical protein [Bdellovibrionales bacterium]
MKTIFFTCLVTLFSTTYLLAQTPGKESLTEELNSSDLKLINSKEFVFMTKDVLGSAWPEITYYALIEASPLEAIGIFAAYDIQKDYIPNLIKSKPVKHVSATDVLTEYELKIPFPLPNAHYIHGAKISRFDKDYKIEWYMAESSSTEDVKGSAYFKEYNGKTFLRYRSYVKPKSIFGGLVKKRMLNDVRETILAIVNFIEKNKRENTPLISKYSEFITRALSGEFVYQTIIDKK